MRVFPLLRFRCSRNSPIRTGSTRFEALNDVQTRLLSGMLCKTCGASGLPHEDVNTAIMDCKWGSIWKTGDDAFFTRRPYR
jgi:hypothetical protein